MDTFGSMITFRAHGVRFTYRVAGVAIHEGKILLASARVDEKVFWFLPGGRAELGESAMETLRREMREELDLEVTVERLLYLIENFFVFDNERFHELGLYFLMHLPADSNLYKQSGTIIGNEQGQPITFAWQPLNTLAQLTLYPASLHKALLELPAHPLHIVQMEGEQA